MLTETTELRQVKSLNNVIEQAHRTIKQMTKLIMRFKSFNSAKRTLRGVEAMNLVRKEQVQEFEQGDNVSQVKFIESSFGIAA
ncbi:IS6 family transposase [Phormidium tenue FACHB-886]|nr:IS6 family transposase [Phormidium tenue FACHB-886]